MLRFFASSFAIAGLIAAAGPVLIHLLNRRRFRVVDWAAMDFLREAMKRRRRIMQLRNLLLLILRVLCVLAFGLALARPYFSNAGDQTVWTYVGTGAAFGVALLAALAAIFLSRRFARGAATVTAIVALGLAAWGVFGVVRESSIASEKTFSGRHPVHAVLVIDNSLSMGCESLQGTLLDRAKKKAIEFVDRLPRESRASVIPLCGEESGYTADAYRNKKDAREAIDRIALTDGTGTVLDAARLANEASRRVTDIPAKRVVFFSDQQRNAWPASVSESDLGDLADLQVVHIAADAPGNLWAADFRVQDGIADAETPAVFLATVRYIGQQSLPDVRVTLTVDGVDAAEQVISLQPGQVRQIVFEHQVMTPVEPGSVHFIAAELKVESETIGGDALKQDNRRFLAVPVVAGLPVVFVDQYGSDEDLTKNRVGETYPLRRLLAPRLQRESFQRHLIQVRHTTIDALSQNVLEDARLVVLAGVEEPGDAVQLLRQYVEQGGPLVIAAGGRFDPGAWTQQAWLDGAGILPVPLSSDFMGETPEEAVDTLKPFTLDFASLQHDYFRIENESRDVLEDLYRLPLFFKAVRANADAVTIDAAMQSEKRRLEATAHDLADRANAHGADTQPDWLMWRPDGAATDMASSIDERVNRERPQVLARFEKDELPFLLERRIGSGRVLLFTSGLHSGWNTLTRTNAVLLFDRIIRGLIEQTMPRRNYLAGEIPLIENRAGERLDYRLQRPSGETQSLQLDALTANTYGLTLPNVIQAGMYRVIATRPGSASEKVREINLAVNSPPHESELAYLDSFDFEQRTAGTPIRWVEQDETISLEGTQMAGHDFWKLLVKLVLIGLLLEMALLARPWARIQMRNPSL